MNKTQQTDPPFPETCLYKDTLYLSGQIGLDNTGQLISTGFEAEVKQVMENIGHTLRKNDLTYNNLINVTIYLTSMDNYAALNAVYSTYFDKKFPARVCIAVKELPRHAQIEIAAIAGFTN